MNISRKIWLIVIILSIAGWWLIYNLGRMAVELFKVIF